MPAASSPDMGPYQRTDVRGVRLRAGANPLGRGDATPRLSWTADAASVAWRQEAAELRLTPVAGLRAGPAPQHVTLTTAESVDIAWPFRPLRSCESVEVAVRVESRGLWSSWSDPVAIEAGLVDGELNESTWIGPAAQERACPLLRCQFGIGEPEGSGGALREVAHARLSITARGLYTAWINGHRVGDQQLTPGWTDYRDRCVYQVYDVTEQLRAGANCLGVMLADGWYRGRLGWEDQAYPALGRAGRYGSQLAAIARLEYLTPDGARHVVRSDETWRWRPGPVRSASLYDGEEFDGRYDVPGWTQPGFDDAGWAAVSRRPASGTELVGATCPPVRCRREVSGVAALPGPAGATIIDFGENLVGRVRLPARARGEVTVRHAEILVDGQLATGPLRTARATDTFRHLEAGRSAEFSVHGFRYAQIQGLSPAPAHHPGQPQAPSPSPALDPGEVHAQVIGTDLTRTGWFSCDMDALNRLHANVVRSAEGNFVSIPTDCPQRDERLGWTGDLQVFAPAACSLFDVSDFLASWLEDLAGAQRRLGGVVPQVVPDILSDVLGSRPLAAWGDAAVVVPWVLYERYGALSILERSYSSVRAWLRHVGACLDDRGVWSGEGQYGDWLDPAAPVEDASAGRTSPSIVATAYAARSADLAGRIAAALHLPDDVASWAQLASRARAGFATFVGSDGAMPGDGVTGYCLALCWGLVGDAGVRQGLARHLVKAVRASGHHIATGFVGTPLVLDALADCGAVGDAYRLLTQTECPSWLYPVTQGATTIWERWDSLRPDGTLNPSGMTSFNHYAFGAVADFLHRRVGGLAPAAPGYRELAIAPLPGPGVSQAEVIHQTPYGRARVAWQLDGVPDGEPHGVLGVEATVPVGTCARVALPGLAGFEVGHGEYRWRVALPASWRKCWSVEDEGRWVRGE